MEHPSSNIDDLLRRRLEHAEVPPPAFVWPNVEAALQRRKRRFFLWFFVAGLAGAGLWMLWSRPWQPGYARIESAATTRTAPATSVPHNATAAASATPEALADAATPARPEPQASGYHRPETAGSRLFVPIKHTDQHVGTGTKGVTSDRTNAVAPRLPEAVPASIGTAAPLASMPAGDPDASVEDAHLNDFKTIRAIPDRHYLHSATSSHTERTTPGLNIIALLPIKRKARCYDFHANRQAWLLDAYAGPSFVHKTLTTNNPEFNDYIQDRLKTEHPGLAFNAGVRASYLFAENFLIRTGLHYEQLSEKFEYIDPNFIKYTIEITQQYINGHWTSVPDTVKIEYGSNYVKTYNRFGLLNIPLQAGLELRSGATGVSLNLGGSLNVLFWKRGSMLALDSKPASFTPAKHQFDIYKSSLGFSLLGSIQWFIHISPHVRLFAEPYYRYNLGPVTQPGYPVKQSSGVGGIRIGVTRIVDRK